ncbi:MAG: S-layer homology domain-containing protein [Symploca sp. SIO2D2]|nr:S-layer homology domain-containing protein [Symploca sp. SIO2D2]
MTNLLQNVLVMATILSLIVAVFFPVSHQAYTSTRISNRVNTNTIEVISSLEQVNQPTQEVALPTKITSVEEISDVSPRDPYFKALKTLIEDYQMDVTLPDGSFRGDQPITRGDLVIYFHDALEVLQLILPPIYPTVDLDEVERVRALIMSISDDHNNVIYQKIEQIKAKLDELESKITTSDKSLLVKLVAALFPTRKQAQKKDYLLVRVDSMDQILDVSSGDPYYDALRDIIEIYGLDLTLPDGTFKGNQPITRGEVIIYLSDSISRVKELTAPSEEENLELRLDNLMSQVNQEYFNFTEKLTKIKQIEARLDELELIIDN